MGRPSPYHCGPFLGGGGMTALTVVAPKIAKLIPRLATDHDGEVLATVHAIRRTLAVAGLDLHDLVGALCAPAPSHLPNIREPNSWFQLCDICLDWPDVLTEKEAAFLQEIGPRLVMGTEPTDKQAAWMRAIYAKVARAAS